MKIRNSIFENSQYLETIVKIHKSDQLGVMDAYRINRLVKKLDELNTEYNELKGKILNQFGTPDSAEGQEGRYSIPPESIEEFNTNEKYDLIFSINVLEHVKDYKKLESIHPHTSISK